MQQEEKKILRSLFIPFLFVFLLWAIHLVQVIGDFKLGFLGVYPLKWSGLIGIITGPLIHGNFSHLIANSVPLIILGAFLVYFYDSLAYRIFIMIYLVTGFWVWVFARDAYHIGASGVVYGLATFILTSGIIKKNTRLSSVALIVVFLYGSLIWGIFPELFPKENISWESHLMGIIAGIVFAWYYKDSGPQKDQHHWDEEDEDYDEEDDDEDAYWKVRDDRS